MRIALVCPYDWSRPGGVQAHVRDLARHLVRGGHDVLALAPGPAPAPDDEPWVRGVGRSTGVPFNGSVAPICFDPRVWPAVRRALRAHEPDVVHVHEPFAPSVSMAGAMLSPAPVLATFHAYYERGSAHDLLYAAARPLLIPVWRRLAARIAVSEPAASIVRARMGVTPRVVPNGVDVARFAGAEPADLPPGRRVLFVGRLERRKGFSTALAAFASMARRRSDLQLVVVGDGPEQLAVDQLGARIRSRVHMLGRLSDADLARCYAAADVFVAPSTGQESFGLVLVEAMAAGVPVVASDLPGYRAVMRGGEAGRLVPVGDADALAAAVDALLDDPAAAARLACAGRRRAAEFSWETVCAALETIYAETAHGATLGATVGAGVGTAPRRVETHGAAPAVVSPRLRPEG